MITISKNLTKGALAIAAGSVALASFAGAAQAAQLNANLGFVPFGSPTFTGANLGSATSITFPALNLVNTIPPTFDPPGPAPAAPNDFDTANPLALAPVNLGTGVTLAPGTLAIGSGLPFSVSFLTAANNLVTFTSSTFTRANATPNDLSLFYTGTFTGTGFDASPGSLSFAFTQTQGGAVNYSAVLASPPVPPTTTPEPSAVLGLLGVVGIGALARRRKS